MTRPTSSYKIDLHVHSGASDGVGDLFDLLDAARARSIHVIAVTDHDALATAVQAYAYLHHLALTKDESSPRAIPGIEISSKIAQEDGSIDVIHMLGLGIDPFCRGLTELCAQRDVARMKELTRRINHVRSMGYELSLQAEARVREAFWGRGELCRELVLSGRFDSVDEAYHAVWDHYPRESGTEDHVSARDAIAAIHDAGGLAVLAHPLRDEISRGFIARDAALRRIDGLVAMGLDGIEAWYRSFSQDECRWLEEVAESRRLLTSCGSDHHDFSQRFHLGKTCADMDGTNTPEHASILAALGVL